MRFEAKPDWLKVKPPAGQNYERIKLLLAKLDLHTVCEEAHCPNVQECWGGGTATLMLMGDTCTRACRFCMVKSGNPRGEIDQWEPFKVAYALAELSLDYVVLTSVDRDDLPDGGAHHFARTIFEIKRRNPALVVEVLIPDFRGDLLALKEVVNAKPHVISHNVETTRRLTPKVRDPRATYDQSLTILAAIKQMDHDIFTKSSIMLGLGETDEELVQTIQDLRTRGVDILTLGQYLRPSLRHLPVMEYVPPDRFEYFRRVGQDLGFIYVASGPLVRTSYRAGEFFLQSMIKNSAPTETPLVQ